MVGIILFFTLIGYHRILSRVPCAIQQVPSAKLPVLASHHLSPLVTIRLFFFSVCESVFCFFFVCLFLLFNAAPGYMELLRLWVELEWTQSYSCQPTPQE